MLGSGQTTPQDYPEWTGFGRRREREWGHGGTAAGSSGDEPGPVAVLDRGRVDDDVHRQPFSVDQDVDFAALHLLAGVAAS
jgi:hypothetical protein